MEHIGQKIKTLRKAADLTQEGLAELLGVSAQAVSKWEVGQASPDLALIAPLCRVFGVTADELLGIEDQRKDKLLKAAREAGREGRYRDAVSLFRQVLVSAPKDSGFIWELCDVMLKADNDPDTLREVVRLAETAVENCRDEELTARLRTTLCRALSDLGEHGEAIRAAEGLSDMHKRHFLLAEISRGQERVDFGAVQIGWEVAELCSLAALLAEDTPFSAEEKISLLQKGISLYRVFYENGDFFHAYGKISRMYWNIALLQLESEKREEAMKALGECVRYALMKDRQSGIVPYSSVLFRRMQYHAGYPAERLTCSKLASSLNEHPALAPLREREDFKALVAELESRSDSEQEEPV